MNTQTKNISLKESGLTPSPYSPEKEVREATHLIMSIGKEALLSIGKHPDEDSQAEGYRLIENDYFRELVSNKLNREIKSSDMKITSVLGSSIEWKNVEVAISTSERNVSEDGTQVGSLVWIVFGEKALDFATGLSTSLEIEEIVYL